MEWYLNLKSFPTYSNNLFNWAFFLGLGYLLFVFFFENQCVMRNGYLKENYSMSEVKIIYNVNHLFHFL